MMLMNNMHLQEELGLEYDEDVDVNLQSYTDMLTSLNKRRKISR
jgi:26S proteasome regulatory subunit (ATPase 3-interacting protein)